MGQKHLKKPKNASGWTKKAPTYAQNACIKRPKLPPKAPKAQKCLGMDQNIQKKKAQMPLNGPKTSQKRPKMPLYAPKGPQNRLKCLQMDQKGLKIGRKCLQMVEKGPKMSPKCFQMGQ